MGTKGDKRVIMAIDPGTTTGVAIQHQDFRTWEFFAVQGHINFWKLITKTDPDVVVLERFQFQNRQKVVLDAVEYIGITKLYCEATHKLLVLQTPSSAKGLWTDDKLKKLGLYEDMSKHSRDAVRHLLYWLTTGAKDMHYANLLRAK